MKILANRVVAMEESETLAMTRIARELKETGIDVISLSIGEPDFNTPEIVKQAGIQAIDHNFSHYPPVPGYPDLRQAISMKFKRDNHLDYAPGQIIVSTGAKQSIYQVVMSLVNPGDEVIVPTPYWVSYKEIVKMAEGVPVYVRATIENDFKVTPRQIKEAITPRTKLIMFSTPSNPTGMLYSKAELKAFAELVADYPDITILSDEIYEHINFEGGHESMAQFDFIKDQVVTVNGVSKGFAMTGWRIGFIGAPPHIAQACEKLQGQITSATCSIAQKAAVAAMELDPKVSEEIIAMRETFRKRRDRMYGLLREIPGFEVRLPQGAFYFFPNVSELYGKEVPEDSQFAKTYHRRVIQGSVDLCMYFLYDAHVALVQGAAFGDDHCVRLSYATSDDKLTEAAQRMKEAVLRLS